MKPEILLKAYVQYQSEDAFRELVAGTLDEVYSTSLRIAQGEPRLAGEIALGAYLALACRARGLGKDVVLASWLRERACKIAVRILRAEDRAIDWAAVKREKNARSTPVDVQSAPPGLAIRICQSVFLTAMRRKRHGLFSPRVWWPAWIRPLHIGGVTACVVVMIVWWHHPFHRHNPIVRSQGVLMTPSSFAQLASPEELPGPTANTNAATNTDQK
jgi:hypothetical protein